ncbi:hypothetical protein [Paenibacillus nasutitermitis]|uniref:Uncharacterized protein n=1 Tax=Paenibacillus nasutitermitis TaxID=1652958 RepID=A0A916YNF3_9BACL|nr:hypothetical protein [Paenibacillus nasutitermitis]GGD51472.1 hypothetical protein GCM10010911_06270 [Paenibacillus nasutitermitis]
MKPEQHSFKRQLDEELDALRFTGHHKVRTRTHPRSWLERLRSIWNTELEIPLLPAGSAVLVLLAIAAVHEWQQSHTDENGTGNPQLIEAGGNTYWDDDYKKAVAMNETDRQD